MGFKKRGQITAFIIMGLVLIISVALLYYLITQQQRTILVSQVEEQFDASIQLDFVDPYVSECLKEVGKKAVTKLAERGGSFEPADYIGHDNIQINLLCTEQFQDSCVNSMLTRQMMERELELEIRNTISSCLDFSIFERKGYQIVEGSTKIDVRIGGRGVSIILNTPFTFIREDREVVFDKFQASVDMPLGELYKLAIDILNSEIELGYFDQDEFMLKETAITIKKFRPYPNIVYSITKDDLTFQFGIQGKETAGSKIPKPKVTLGSCVNPADNLCFNNVPSQACSLRLGRHQSFECDLPSFFNEVIEDPALCEGKPCNNCTATWEYFTQDYTGQSRKHGESWCVYDGPVGPGFDYVGSRHYKHTCIDGEEFVEPCRDYREELCTVDTLEGDIRKVHEKAVCRVNRWNSCRFCTTKQCCENRDNRDCYWSDWLDTRDKCLPYVPPGLKFWEGSGNDVCFYANQKKKCEGFSCPNNWVDSAALYCLFQGDCGNFRNVADRLTTDGFFETDMFDTVREYVYLSEGRTDTEGLNGRLNLGNNNRDYEELYIDEVEAALDRFSAQITAILDFLDDASTFNFADYLNPFNDEPEFEVTDFSFCSLWQPPLGSDDCDFCNEFKNKPCTEYLCKSLGQNCEFELINESIPNCFAVDEDDDIPPMIDINEDTLIVDYEAVQTTLDQYQGYEIRPALVPHLPFILGISTSEPTRCKLDFTPFFRYATIPSYWFGDESFSTTHNMSIRIPPDLKIPQVLLDIFNITTEGDIARILENPEEVYEDYRDSFEELNDLYEEVTGRDVLDEINPYIVNVITLLRTFSPQLIMVLEELLQQMHGGGYYLFVHCVDKAGNENDEEFFIKIDIDRTAEDTFPPIVLRAIPPNNTKIMYTANDMEVSLYLNEPSQCRYSNISQSYEVMEQSFECALSPYEMTPIAGGSYECKNMIPTQQNGTRIFVRCSDNPIITDEYRAAFIPFPDLEILGEEPSRYYNVSSPNKVTAAESFAKRGLRLFVNTSEIELNLYLNSEKQCRYSDTTTNFDEMENSFDECVVSPDLEIGSYLCPATMEVEGYAALFNKSFNLGNYTINFVKANNTEVLINTSESIRVNQSRITMSFDTGKLTGNDTIEFNSSVAEVVLLVNETSECRWTAVLNQSYKNMTEPPCYTENNLTVCGQSFYIIENVSLRFECRNKTEELKNEYTIKCRDVITREPNVNEEDYIYNLIRSDPLSVNISPSGDIFETTFKLSLGPSGDIVEDGISCGYNDDPIFGYINMITLDNKTFEETMSLEPGYYEYYFLCRDRYGNRVYNNTDIVII